MQSQQLRGDTEANQVAIDASRRHTRDATEELLPVKIALLVSCQRVMSSGQRNMTGFVMRTAAHVFIDLISRRTSPVLSKTVHVDTQLRM